MHSDINEEKAINFIFETCTKVWYVKHSSNDYLYIEECTWIYTTNRLNNIADNI